MVAFPSYNNSLNEKKKNDGDSRFDRLAEAICLLTTELQNLRQDKTNAILQRIAQMETNIMSAISEYSDTVNVKFDEISTSVDEIVTSQAGVTADVAGLKEIILKLQNNPGPISPEDQTLLTQGVEKVTALAAKTAAVSAALKELDAATAPAEIPPAPPA